MNNPNEIDVTHLYVCACCLEVMNKHEQGDPCIIDGESFDDFCASDLTHLRLEGYISTAKSKTEKVVDAHNRKLDAALAEMIYPINSIRHI